MLLLIRQKSIMEPIVISFLFRFARLFCVIINSSIMLLFLAFMNCRIIVFAPSPPRMWIEHSSRHPSATLKCEMIFKAVRLARLKFGAKLMYFGTVFSNVSCYISSINMWLRFVDTSAPVFKDCRRISHETFSLFSYSSRT